MTDTGPRSTTFPRVEVIVPVYRERPEALQATLGALLGQEYPITAIYVIDDHSPMPVLLRGALQQESRIQLSRMEKNGGISAARNCGIAKSAAPFVACINCEILLAKNWVQSCVSYISAHPRAGVAFTRMVPSHPNRLLTRWRMRFQETRFPDVSGQASFAPGHAMIFRREALERVGGFRVGMRCDEDSDICFRIADAGWETHFVADSECVSIQEDTLPRLAQKELTRSNWESPEDYALSKFISRRIKMTLVRMARNVVKLRLDFLPVDFAVWVSSMKMAFARATRARKKRRTSPAI